MHAQVLIRLPDGTFESLVPGDILGRTWSAAVRFDDPDVSEAHAMVSLRGPDLVLLALRRRFYVDGKATDAVSLREGLAIRLTPTVEIVVERVTLPDWVLGLEGEGLATQALPGTCSLVFDPRPRLVPGTEGVATFFLSVDSWRVRTAAGTTDFGPGDAILAEGIQFRGLAVPLEGASPTQADSLGGPLRVIAWYDTVHVHRGDHAPTVLSGQLARLVSELVSIGAPVPWEDVAAALWPSIADRNQLRRRWDVLLVRLRQRLRDGGVRPDLVRSSRVGLVELLVGPGDTLEDRT